MSFKEVDNGLWRRIRSYIPRQKPKTGRRADLRDTFNGILYVLYTGCRWVEVPKKYGAFENCMFSMLQTLSKSLIFTQQKTFGFLHAPCLRAKSTVHRLHLKLSKEGVYDKIFAILLSEGYESWKIDLSLSFVDTKYISAKKGV